jgi:hypothetical protein
MNVVNRNCAARMHSDASPPVFKEEVSRFIQRVDMDWVHGLPRHKALIVHTVISHVANCVLDYFAIHDLLNPSYHQLTPAIRN